MAPGLGRRQQYWHPCQNIDLGIKPCWQVWLVFTTWHLQKSLCRNHIFTWINGKHAVLHIIILICKKGEGWHLVPYFKVDAKDAPQVWWRVAVNFHPSVGPLGLIAIDQRLNHWWVQVNDWSVRWNLHWLMPHWPQALTTSSKGDSYYMAFWKFLSHALMLTLEWNMCMQIICIQPFHSYSTLW